MERVDCARPLAGRGRNRPSFPGFRPCEIANFVQIIGGGGGGGAVGRADRPHSKIMFIADSD